MRRAGIRQDEIRSLLKLLGAVLKDNREVGHVGSRGVTNIGADVGQNNLYAMANAHYLSATRRDSAIHQKPIEGDALIAQGIARESAAR